MKIKRIILSRNPAFHSIVIQRHGGWRSFFMYNILFSHILFILTIRLEIDLVIKVIELFHSIMYDWNYDRMHLLTLRMN